MTDVFVESTNTCVYQDLHAHSYKVFMWKKLSLHDKNEMKELWENSFIKMLPLHNIN